MHIFTFYRLARYILSCKFLFFSLENDDMESLKHCVKLFCSFLLLDYYYYYYYDNDDDVDAQNMLIKIFYHHHHHYYYYYYYIIINVIIN